MENIVENNKLIADFLEWKNSNWTVPTKGFEIGRKYDLEIPNGLKLYKEEEIQIEGEWGYADVEQERCFYEDLLFHSDWNWLMKAVKRIDEISLNAPTIWNLEGKTTDIFNSIREVNIELTYNRVIDFINFYNNQNKIHTIV